MFKCKVVRQTNTDVRKMVNPPPLDKEEVVNSLTVPTDKPVDYLLSLLYQIDLRCRE